MTQLLQPLTSPTQSQSQSPFTVRLWEPEADQPDDCQFLPKPARRQEDLSVMGQLTIRQAFLTHMLKQLQTDQKAKSTIEAYLNAIGHWERILLSLHLVDPSLPKDPQLYQIDDETCENFRAYASNGNPATTCNKWFRHIRAVLNLMGPRLAHSKRSRRNRCYFIEVPWLEDLPENEPQPVQMPDDHVDRLYASCPKATWPLKKRTGCLSGDWWQCSLVLLVTYGMRREDWLWLRRDSVNFDKKSLVFRAKKTKKNHLLVTNPYVTAHLLRLNTTTDLFFNPTLAHKQLYEQWHKLQDAAGIARPDGLHYTFKDLRQTCASRYHEQFPHTAELLLGHALPRSSKVTFESYIGDRLIAPVHNAIRKIKPPESFLSLEPKTLFN
jgi:integrase